VKGPSSSLRDRVLAVAATRPSAIRQTHRLRRLAFVLLVLAAIIGSSSLLAGHHSDVPQRPMAYVIAMLSACVFVAILTAYYTLGPTSSALGRSSRFYRILTIATPCLLAVAALIANLLAPVTMVAQTAPTKTHFSCSMLTLIAGVAVLAVLLVLERRTSTTLATLKGASFGAVAAAWATLFISISCPYTHPLHVVPTHILVPMIPLIVGGVLGGARYLSMRANHSSESN
jgi:hypothetical protein